MKESNTSAKKSVSSTETASRMACSEAPTLFSHLLQTPHAFAKQMGKGGFGDIWPVDSWPKIFTNSKLVPFPKISPGCSLPHTIWITALTGSGTHMIHYGVLD